MHLCTKHGIPDGAPSNWNRSPLPRGDGLSDGDGGRRRRTVIDGSNAPGALINGRGRIDREVPEPAAIAALQRIGAEEDADASVRRVLVVDDEATQRVFARALLEQQGFHVSEATDGIEALERLGVEAYDLMILDLEHAPPGGL